MNNTDEIVATLRQKARELDPVALAELLGRLVGGGLTQSVLISWFRRAFPSIPLGVLNQAIGWHRVCANDMTDDQFAELLRPWINAAVQHE